MDRFDDDGGRAGIPDADEDMEREEAYAILDDGGHDEVTSAAELLIDKGCDPGIAHAFAEDWYAEYTDAMGDAD